MIALVIPAAYHSAKSHGGVDTNGTAIAVPGADAFNKAQMELGLGNLDADGYHGLKIISRGTAILLLLVYVAYLLFQVGLCVTSQYENTSFLTCKPSCSSAPTLTCILPRVRMRRRKSLR